MDVPSLTNGKAFLHTASPPTKQARSALEPYREEAEHSEPVTVEAASSTIHLVDLADGRHTLCGLPISQVLTGGYCEHLDCRIDDPQFERAIFARDGRQAESCETCLSRQPAVLAISEVEHL